MVLGAAGSAVFVGAGLGFRSDWGLMAGETIFWVKLVYALGLGGVALWACERLSRPAGEARGRAAWIVAPLLVLAALAAWQWMRAPAVEHPRMLMGESALVCPWFILAASLPPLLGLTWAVRGLAPTRLRPAGAMLGLAAGGTGAAVYALHCPEPTAPFVAVWYTLGIAGAAALGALAGPRALRW